MSDPSARGVRVTRVEATEVGDPFADDPNRAGSVSDPPARGVRATQGYEAEASDNPTGGVRTGQFSTEDVEPDAEDLPDAQPDGDPDAEGEGGPWGGQQRSKDADASDDITRSPVHPLTRSFSLPSGIERAVSLFFRRYDRLPRAIYLHRQLVQRPSFFYLLLLGLIVLTAMLAVGAALLGWTVLALCLLPLGLAFALLWRRGPVADAGSTLATTLTVTGLALLAGTQIVYLKDFLSGGDYYRMNTLFKFFSQVWVMWGVAAAIAVPRIWSGWAFPSRSRHAHVRVTSAPASFAGRALRWTWAGLFALLLLASLVYPLLGTPTRLDTRMVGWRPAIGTLNGLDFMRAGSYTWPDGSNVIELRYDYEALQWLLDNVPGNRTILESSEVEYYRAFGSRISSYTGLSGLKGMHEQEQRYGEDVGYRDGLHREIWDTQDIARTQQIIDELRIDLIYVGQLERYLHPAGVAKFEQMAANGQLSIIFQNERVTIYATNWFAPQG